MTMAEDSAEGVYYYSGRTIPAEGVYADVQDGKNYPACAVAVAVLALVMFCLVWLAVTPW